VAATAYAEVGEASAGTERAAAWAGGHACRSSVTLGAGVNFLCWGWERCRSTFRSSSGLRALASHPLRVLGARRAGVARRLPPRPPLGGAGSAVLLWRSLCVSAEAIGGIVGSLAADALPKCRIPPCAASVHSQHPATPVRTLIDNTFLHRIGEAATARESIPLIDCFAVLALAEQIMFCDDIEVSGFESDQVRTRSEETIALLQQEGVGSRYAPVVQLYSFGRAEYAQACDGAVADIRTIIENSPVERLIEVGKQADASARPVGIVEQPLLAWADRAKALPRQIDEIRAAALDRKAIGSFDYIVASDRNVRTRLRELTTGPAVDVPHVVSGLSVIFRASVNQHLATNRGGFYAPAPKRAAMLCSVTQGARAELSRHLTAFIAEKKKTTEASAGWTQVLGQDVRLPLPLFAIHFLRKNKAKGVMDILAKAAELRHDPDVRILRSFFARFETATREGDPYTRLKMENRLAQAAADVRTDLGSVNSASFTLLLVALNPLLRRLNTDGDLKLEELPRDLETELELVSAWRRRLLLGRLTAEMIHQPSLYADLVKLFGNLRIIP